MARKTKREAGTPHPNKERQDAFITEFIANGLRKKAAADATGNGWSTVKEWFQFDEDFNQRVQDAKAEWLDNLRAAALKRAIQKSDTLMIFLMKSLDPECYDDNVRRAKWLAENNIQDPDAQGPVNVYLMRDAEPERLADEVPVPEEPETEH